MAGPAATLIIPVENQVREFDAKLLLEDPEGPVSEAIQLCSHVVVVENEALSGAGLLLSGQKLVSQRLYLVSQRFPWRAGAKQDHAFSASGVIVGIAVCGSQRVTLEQPGRIGARKISGPGAREKALRL